MEKSFFLNNLIFVLLFILNIIIKDYNFYLQLIYLLVTIYHIYISYLVVMNNWKNNKYKIKVFFYTSILLYIFTYFIIYDTNPFFYIFEYYIFFPHFLKAILIVLIHTYVLSKFLGDGNNINYKENIEYNINKENAPLKKENSKNKYFNLHNYYFLCDYVNYFAKYKICFCIFLLFLVLIITIEIKIFSQRIKLWVNYNDKTKTLPVATSKNTTFYITAMIVNMENIIQLYIIEMKKLIKYLGEQNVIISIVENGDSKDNTNIYLKEFQKYLNEKNIINRFLLEHEIYDPRLEQSNFEYQNSFYLRIKYYAQLRNKCFDLLYDLPNFDFDNTKIIYFNDIVFEYENIINLLSTNNEDYDAVCGLDFYDCFYDSWVSIDLSAYSLQHDFPYFINKEGQDLVINHKPIRVFSCWNGVIAFSAAPLKGKNLQFRYEIDPDREPKHYIFNDQNYNFESECTYFHIDLFSLGYTKKFINPDVRVAYLYEYYNLQKDGYTKSTDINSYFKLYFRGLLHKRNKDMSNYKDKNIKLNKILENWYLENKKNKIKSYDELEAE